MGQTEEEAKSRSRKKKKRIYAFKPGKRKRKRERSSFFGGKSERERDLSVRKEQTRGKKYIYLSKRSQGVNGDPDPLEKDRRKGEIKIAPTTTCWPGD